MNLYKCCICSEVKEILFNVSVKLIIPNNFENICCNECIHKSNLNKLSATERKLASYKKFNLINKNKDYGLFKRYYVIRTRCFNKNSWNYKYYGLIGIKFEWDSYEHFKEDMFSSYKEHVDKYGISNTSIDRINPFGNYSKDNCRWVTYAEQKRNKRCHHTRG